MRREETPIFADKKEGYFYKHTKHWQKIGEILGWWFMNHISIHKSTMKSYEKKLWKQWKKADLPQARKRGAYASAKLIRKNNVSKMKKNSGKKSGFHRYKCDWTIKSASKHPMRH